MFVFDLFEKKKQDAAAGRFVGGTSQDARVKNALDNAYRAVPAAKSPEEAALGYIDIQNSLNQKQDQALDQQTKTNQQQTQQINDLVADMRRKEKDFRDLNAQIANMPNVTPQQAAKMAQDIEAAHSSDKGEPVDVSNVIAKQTATPATQPAKTVAAPSPGASISQLANYQQAKDQGAATAKTQPAAPQATPAPAPAVTPPGRVIKGKNQSDALGQMTQQLTTPPAQKTDNVVDFAQQKANRSAKVAGIQLDQPAPAADQKVMNFKEQAPAGSDPTSIAKYNIEQLSKAYMSDARSVTMEFTTGQGLALQNTQIRALVDVISNLHDGANKQALLINLFSNRNFLIEWMFENILNKPAQATQQPDAGQLEIYEGDVVPMTQDQSVLQAYNDVLEILKASKTKQPDVVTMMRQDWAGRYKQRFQISTAPDGNYYMLDKTTNQRHRLPDPRTFPMEEDAWHNGQNSWSSEHDQWAKESTDPTSAKDTIQRYLGIDKETDVEAVKAAIHAIGSDPTLKPNSKARLLGQVGMIINLNRLPIGRTYYQFMQRFIESQIDEAQLSVGDPIVVTAPNEYEGKTGEISEFSPSGKFVIVNLYNHGEHSMHLSDVEYNKYADEVDEGWSDAMLSQRTGQPRTPYSVYIKGKKWKDFENDDHAEAVANKLRAKFKADGRDPGVITIAPTDMSEAISKKDLVGRLQKDLPKVTDPKNKNARPVAWTSPGKDDYGYTGYQGHGMPTDKAERARIRADKKKGVAEAGSPAQQAAIAVAMKKAGKKPKNESDGDWVDDPTAHAQVNRSGFNKLTPQSYADKIDFIDRQLADPRQQQNWPEFKQRRLDLMTAAQRAGIVKEQDRVTEIKKGQKDSNGYTKCWSGYHAAGTKKSATTGKQVRNCVPNESVAEAIPVIRGTQPTGAQYANQLAKIAMKLAKQRHADGLRNDAKDFNKAAKLFAAGDVDAGAEIIAYEMDTEPADEFYAYMEHYKIPTEIVFGLNESQTDYSKRRERKVDAGQPVSRQPKNPQTDYAKKRAKDKRDMEQFGESTNYWTRLQNERNTKVASLVSELTESVKDIK